jgi:hypothetical protein
MARRERKRSTRNGRNKNIVQADRVGNTRVPSSVLDVLAHPDATPLHQIPQSDEEEAVLSKIENLLGKGHYGAAIRDAKALKIPHSPLAAQYEFLLQEKISRAYIGIADRYFIRGDKESAKKFFVQAIKPNTSNQVILSVASLAEQAFDKILNNREEILNSLVSSIKDNNFVDWCEKKNSRLTETVIDTDTIREAIFADFSMEDVFGDVPPISPSPGWVDPLPPETEFIDHTSVTPASIFKADTPKSVDVDVSILSHQDGENNRRIRASVAMPVISNVLMAKTRLFAIAKELTPTGQAQGVVPTFRYEYLRDKAKEIIAHIKDVDSRMLPIQFRLDDFTEIVSTVRRPLLEKTAELAAVNQKIKELTETLNTLVQLEKEMANVVILLDNAQDECDCDWWCWVSALAYIVTAAALIVVIGALCLASFGAGIALAPILGGIGGLLVMAAIDTINCDYVGQIGTAARTIHTGLQKSIEENKAELNYQLSARDLLIANINILTANLQEINASNQSRLLNATTLNAIQTQYNSIRQSLLIRAQAVAKLAEDAFNFERDSNVHLIRSMYFDENKKGYTAVETLLRDLDGLDYIDITGRTQKVMQLTNVVSLLKHYPISFPSILVAGRARFMTTMEDFDRWFPGTYMQRIKEVRVEVLVKDKPVPAHGYISNDGVSFVRFSDTGNKIPVDRVNVFDEPDLDLAKLCYKRTQRRRHIDTMAFPEFKSYLHEERMRKVQEKEHNYFENVGPESSWLIELLPDQPFDFSKITDVRVYFQYEAFFDENLKRILQPKRYTGRRESIVLSIKKLIENEGGVVVADFSSTVKVNISRTLFEVPIINKKIVNVGFAIKPKGTSPLNGISKLEVSFQDAAPIQVETNNEGIVATASDHPTGTGLAELDALIHDKNVDGKWTVKIVQLPSGIDADDIEDIFLLLNYEYSP